MKEISSFILQPQSEIDKVRRYLNEHGYRIVEERMVEESGKFYPMMRPSTEAANPMRNMNICTAKGFLREKDPVLRTYLLREQGIREVS
mgnify:CR=1 FL=1